MSVRRAAIVAAARGWIGTPYRHQASLKGVGCDCLGLVRGVWRECAGAEPQPIAAYAPDWALSSAGEPLLEAAARRAAIADGLGLGFHYGETDPADLIEVLPPRPEWQAPVWLVTHVDLHRTPKVQAAVRIIKDTFSA